MRSSLLCCYGSAFAIAEPCPSTHEETATPKVRSRTLCGYSARSFKDYPDEWPQAAPWATYCYNAKYNTTTGTSPFYAKHAVEPKQPVDFLLPRVGGLEAPRSIAELSDRIGEINEAVEQGVARLHSSYVQRNANLRGARDFRAGDQVWKHRVYPESFEAAGIDTKFHLPFEPEPYLVLERRSERHSRIRLAHNDAAPYEDVHHLRLKLCAPRDDAIQFHQAVPLPSSAHGSDSDNDDNDSDSSD